MTNLTMQIQFKELNYRGRSAAPRGEISRGNEKGNSGGRKERVARRSERIFEREYV